VVVPPPSEPPVSSAAGATLGAVLVACKVALVIGAWLLVFLTMMLGYLTLPILALVGYLVLFGGIDVIREIWRRHHV